MHILQLKQFGFIEKKPTKNGDKRETRERHERE